MKCLLPLALLVTVLSSAAAAQGPRLVVLNKEDATLVTMDPATGKILGTVPTGEGPHEVAVSADGRTAYVGNYGGASGPGSTISVVDLGAMKELRRFDVNPLRRPHGMFVTDGKLYFTAETNRLVGRYDPASNQIDWLFGTGQASTHMVWVSRDAANTNNADERTTNTIASACDMSPRGSSRLAVRGLSASNRASTRRLNPIAALRAATIATRIQPIAPSRTGTCCAASSAPASANGSANTEWLNRTNDR